MSNRYYTSQFSHSFERMLVSLMGNITAGSGSNLSVVGLKGAAIAKTGTGLYTITLEDKYKAMIGLSITMKSALASDIQAQVVSEDVSSAQTIVIRTTVAGVATDIPSGDGMIIRIDLRNSSS